MKINLIEIQTRLRRAKQYVRKDVFSSSNLIVVALAGVAILWFWGSISVMGQNHLLRQELEAKKRDARIAEIESQTLQFEQNYLKSAEFQELAAREKLGLVAEGEHVLILSDYEEEEKEPAIQAQKRSNFAEWMNFLFGGNAKKSTK